jgi:hypothetical protein
MQQSGAEASQRFLPDAGGTVSAAQMTRPQSRRRSYTFGGVPGRGLDAGLKAGSMSTASKAATA